MPSEAPHSPKPHLLQETSPMCCPSRRDRRSGLWSHLHAACGARMCSCACLCSHLLAVAPGCSSQEAQQCLWETVGRQAQTNHSCHRSNRENKHFPQRSVCLPTCLFFRRLPITFKVKIHIFQNDTKALLSLASSPAQPSTNGTVSGAQPSTGPLPCLGFQLLPDHFLLIF